MITLSVGHKNYFVSDLLIDFQIKFSLSIGEIVTHWFALIVLSALRRFDNKNMLSLVILILRSILTDLQETSKGSRGRYEHASPVSLKAQDGGDHMMMNRDYAWSDTAGYDKTKVECFNCHKMGHFAKECRSLRNQERMARNQESSRKIVNVEDTSSKAMVAIDGVGFNWSYMADNEVPTNMALMAFSYSEVHNSKTCSNTCHKSYKTLKNQYENLRIEFNKSKFDLAAYKRGLASVEEQLVFYKKNEVVFCDQIDVLKRDASFRDSEIIALNLQLEKLMKEKESNQIKIDNFENASKSLDKLIGNLSNYRLEEFQYTDFESYRPKASKSVCVDTSNEIKKASDALIIKDWEFDCDGDEFERSRIRSGGFVCRSFSHLIKDCDFQDKKMVQKPVLKTVEKETGQREVRPVCNNAMRVNHQYFSNSRRNFAPIAVLTKSGLIPISTVRVSSAVRKRENNAVKSSACWVWRPKIKGDPQDALRDTRIFDSGGSRHRTGNKSYLLNYQEYDGGFVAFAGSSKEGKITGKGKIRTGKLDFKDVYFVKELKFNLFSVSQMCDKKNSILSLKLNVSFFLLILSCPMKIKYCLRRLGHINFKTMNKLVKGNLVRGLPLKIFENDHTCVACQKGKQHKASWIKREFGNARTPQQNGVAETKNRTLIEAARTMLADSRLPIPFWAEAVNTTCYVQNRVLATKC
nr:hypothetical protein [Tanacetum cinerariifolium]